MTGILVEAGDLPFLQALLKMQMQSLRILMGVLVKKAVFLRNCTDCFGTGACLSHQLFTQDQLNEGLKIMQDYNVAL